MIQGTTSISGLASGFDWRQLVDDLIAIDRRRITGIENQQAIYKSQIAAWQSLNTSLLSLKTAADGLRNPEIFSSYRGTMISDNPGVKAVDLVSPSMSSEATEGTYSLVVDETAAAQRLSSGAITSASEALGLSGDITINNVVVTLEETDSLSDVRTKINNAGAGVMASLVSYESDDHRLTLTSRTTGAAGISLANAGSSDILGSLGLVEGERVIKHEVEGVGEKSDGFTHASLSIAEMLGLTDAQSGEVSINGLGVNIDLAVDSLNDIASKIDALDGLAASVVTEGTGQDTRHRLLIEGTEGIYVDDNSILETLGVLRGEVSNEIAQGRDAEVKIDGITVTRATNTIEGVIEGVTLNLLAADPDTTITLSVDRHHGAAEEKIKAFVSAYNAVASFISNQSHYDEETKKAGGVLFGDGTLASVRGNLSGLVLQEITGVDPDFSRMALVGISLNREGLLTIDQATLSENLKNNFEDVVSLFSARGSTEGEHLSFVTHGSSTQPGTYEVDITQAATRAQAVGEPLSEGLDKDVTVAIQIGGAQTSISLTEGMTVSEIVDSVNARLVEAGMAASASEGESNNLVITQDNYGSSARFVIQVIDGEGDLGVADGLYQGLDVAGTINGEEAVGAGRRLTGAADSSVAGLAVRYTGDEAMEAGTVTFTAGMAELFSRTLSGITDPRDGYLTFKQESLRSTVETLDSRKEEMTVRIDRKMEMMINRFVIMESALQQLESQSRWLEGQLSSLRSNWRKS